MALLITWIGRVKKGGSPKAGKRGCKKVYVAEELESDSAPLELPGYRVESEMPSHGVRWELPLPEVRYEMK